MKVLVTIASEQIWPQIVPFYIVKPERVVILHSANLAKSKKPAKRLADFFRGGEASASRVNVILREMSELDYPDFINDDISDSDEVYVNLTGGLKTMSIMLHSWAMINKAQEFYINEKNKIQWFLFENGVFQLDRQEDIPEAVMREINEIDPLSIAKLYYGAEHISGDGLVRSEDDIRSIFRNSKTPSYKTGAKLEEELLYFFLDLFKNDKSFGLKNCKLRHSVRLRSENSDNDNEEIDILLNYNCSLIIVECKMRKKIRNLYHSYRQMIANCYNGQDVANEDAFNKLMTKIKSDISDNKFLQYKADLFSARLLSGLKARVIWVTTSIQQQPKALEMFCTEHNIEHIMVELPNGNYLSKESKEKLRETILRCR